MNQRGPARYGGGGVTAAEALDDEAADGVVAASVEEDDDENPGLDLTRGGLYVLKVDSGMPAGEKDADAGAARGAWPSVPAARFCFFFSRRLTTCPTSSLSFSPSVAAVVASRRRLRFGSSSSTAGLSGDALRALTDGSAVADIVARPRSVWPRAIVERRVSPRGTGVRDWAGAGRRTTGAGRRGTKGEGMRIGMGGPETSSSSSAAAMVMGERATDGRDWTTGGERNGGRPLVGEKSAAAGARRPAGEGDMYGYSVAGGARRSTACAGRPSALRAPRSCGARLVDGGGVIASAKAAGDGRTVGADGERSTLGGPATDGRTGAADVGADDDDGFFPSAPAPAPAQMPRLALPAPKTPTTAAKLGLRAGADDTDASSSSSDEDCSDDDASSFSSSTAAACRRARFSPAPAEVERGRSSDRRPACGRGQGEKAFPGLRLGFVGLGSGGVDGPARAVRGARGGASVSARSQDGASEKEDAPAAGVERPESPPSS